jgi:hypothetical protein
MRTEIQAGPPAGENGATNVAGDPLAEYMFSVGIFGLFLYPVDIPGSFFSTLPPFP